jgi:hypothetical protein
MIKGVKVRIVISTPGNEDSYSTMKNRLDIVDKKTLRWTQQEVPRS